MEILSKFIYVVMLLSAAGVIVLVLLQHGKGADMGTGFGAGASGSLFGATGSANFLSRTTGVLAAVFFVSTLALAYFATNRPKAGGGVMQSLPAQAAPVSSGIPTETAPRSAPVPVVPGEADKADRATPKQSEIPK